MSNKAATISVRIDPEIKKEAEGILEELGLSMSVAIDTFCRQIVLTKGLPYKVSLPTLPSLDEITKEEFDETMAKSHQEILDGKGIELSEAFNQILEGLK
ncbi:MAG: type II toxin-antitoxin system RelB/DinJ family antitoxin [Clostridia bacterium]|nr:type II toxin-antitoxin system RelB/DinJ family antitoxin [Clostridia bacterium]